MCGSLSPSAVRWNGNSWSGAINPRWTPWIPGWAPYLRLEGEDGWHEDVDEERLSVLFAGRQGPGRVRAPTLVVLNACQSATIESARATLGLAPVLVQRGQLLAAVGMQFPIDDNSARLFAAKFYEALFRAGQVDYAIAKARNAIISAKRGVEGRDWGRRGET